MLIRMDGQYQTGDGRKVRVLCVDGPTKHYPVVAIIGEGDYAQPGCFTEHGKYFFGQDHSDDLIPIEELFYIASPYGPCGNCISWWAVNGNGYTTDLNKAWKVSHVKAAQVVAAQRGDKAYAVAVVDRIALRHVDIQTLAIDYPAAAIASTDSSESPDGKEDREGAK